MKKISDSLETGVVPALAVRRERRVSLPKEARMVPNRGRPMSTVKEQILTPADPEAEFD